MKWPVAPTKPLRQLRPICADWSLCLQLMWQINLIFNCEYSKPSWKDSLESQPIGLIPSCPCCPSHGYKKFIWFTKPIDNVCHVLTTWCPWGTPTCSSISWKSQEYKCISSKAAEIWECSDSPLEMLSPADVLLTWNPVWEASSPQTGQQHRPVQLMCIWNICLDVMPNWDSILAGFWGAG